MFSSFMMKKLGEWQSYWKKPKAATSQHLRRFLKMWLQVSVLFCIYFILFFILLFAKKDIQNKYTCI